MKKLTLSIIVFILSHCSEKDMKLIILNFGRWNNGANGGRLRRIYKRVYIQGYKWTPFVTVRFKWLPIN